MKIKFDVGLQWDGPIGHLLEEVIRPDMQVLTFSRIMDLPFLPPVGMVMFFTIPMIHPMHGGDEIASSVQRVDWMEGEDKADSTPEIWVELKRVMMGESPATREDAMDEIEWMEAHGFAWQERQYHAQRVASQK